MTRPLTPEQTVRLCLADAMRTGGVEAPEYEAALAWLKSLTAPRVVVDEEHEVVVHLPRRPSPAGPGRVAIDLHEVLPLGALAEWGGVLLVVVDHDRGAGAMGVLARHVLQPWKRDVLTLVGEAAALADSPIPFALVDADRYPGEERVLVQEPPHQFLDGTRRLYLDDELAVGALVEARGELWRVEQRDEYAAAHPHVLNAVRYCYRVVPA